MPSELRAGVLVTRRFPGYKDIPGVQYHFPKHDYQRQIGTLVGALVLLYEPRRGGTSPTSSGGGRMAFTGLAYIERIWDDPEDPTYGYAGLRDAIDFNTPVPIHDTAIKAKALQSAVLPIPFATAAEISARGLSVPALNGLAEYREGLADTVDLSDLVERPFVEVVQNRSVRDASFRYRVVERAYDGTCAFTGMRLTNGYGRAEVDAAHIIPVADKGPDTVRNGIALTKSMHWAFDRGLISLSDSGRILTVDRGFDDAALRMLRADRRAILPNSDDEKPHVAFLAWHRQHKFKGAA
jgi:putative restriction endonuclease